MVFSSLSVAVSAVSRCSPACPWPNPEAIRHSACLDASGCCGILWFLYRLDLSDNTTPQCAASAGRRGAGRRPAPRPRPTTSTHTEYRRCQPGRSGSPPTGRPLNDGLAGKAGSWSTLIAADHLPGRRRPPSRPPTGGATSPARGGDLSLAGSGRSRAPNDADLLDRRRRRRLRHLSWSSAPAGDTLHVGRCPLPGSAGRRRR